MDNASFHKPPFLTNVDELLFPREILSLTNNADVDDDDREREIEWRNMRNTAATKILSEISRVQDCD